eukprot:gene19993-26706_t
MSKTQALEKALEQLHYVRSTVYRLPEEIAYSTPSEIVTILETVQASVTSLTSNWAATVQATVTSLTSNWAAVTEAVNAVPKPEDRAQAKNSAPPTQQWGAALGALDSALQEQSVTAHDGAHRGGPKRQRIGEPPTASEGEVDPSELQGVIERVKAACPGMVLYPCSSSGTVGCAVKDACELRLAYPKVFCASLALSGAGHVRVVRVLVDMYDKAADLGAWSPPSCQLFRRVSPLATRALSYLWRRAPCCIQLAAPGELPTSKAESVVLEDLMLWLSSYRDIFTRPCCMSGKLLAWDPTNQFPLPPVFRPYM